MAQSDSEILKSISDYVGQDLGRYPGTKWNRAGQLVSLYAAYTYMPKLPLEICQLRNLTTLDLGNNILEELPPEIGNLSSLARLALNSNRLKRLPSEIGNLSNLTTLDLRSNQLNELPVEIVQMSNVRKLYLSNNQLSKLPSEIVQMYNLQRLNLNNNQLTELPIEIFQMSKLRRLHLTNNRLREFPAEIVQLNNLTSLSLGGNELRSLPVELNQLSRLQELSADNNPLTYPPLLIVREGIKAIKRFFEENPNKQAFHQTIERLIEFAPEHKQAGIGILNYFGDVLDQKYPDMDVKISIQQDGNKVTMIIDPPEGEIEIIQQTLEDYSLVVTGKKPVEEFLDEPTQIIQLQNKLDMALMEIKQNERLLIDKDRQIDFLENLAMSFSSRPINVTNQLHAGNVLANNEAQGDIAGGDKIIDQDNTSHTNP
ncbi:MAG: leucine-rich repeat domain-containing protein [Chloroflexota bacterium]